MAPLPPDEQLLRIATEDLAFFVLEDFKRIYADRALGRGECFSNYYGKNTGRVDQIGRAVSEAWSWLVRHGLLVVKPGSNDWYIPSREADAINRAEDLQAFRRARVLPRDLLHPAVLSATSGSLDRGRYDTAVFEAFKEVEVAVRTACGYGEGSYGVHLMNDAFRPAGGGKPVGPLTNEGSESSEQEALRSLFAGAIGSYKNPHSHRHVSLTAEEAVEMLVLASHLRGIVDARGPSGSAQD